MLQDEKITVSVRVDSQTAVRDIQEIQKAVNELNKSLKVTQGLLQRIDTRNLKNKMLRFLIRLFNL